MHNGNKQKRTERNIVYTVLVAIILFAMFLMVVRYSYDNARKNGVERLHLQTKEVKEDIELQMLSDRENLQTMARFAAKLYADGENYGLILNNFKPIGLIENVGILHPDNTFETRVGVMDVSDKLSFEEEAKRAPYVSGIVEDMTSGRKIVRSAVRITVEDKLVGILYGVIELNSLEKRLMHNSTVSGTQIFVIERGNGDFIVNTISDKVENISVLQSRKFIENYSYGRFKKAIISGEKGYSAFVSQIIEDTTLYLHYSPLDIEDWQIVMAEPENSVFSEAIVMGRMLAIMFSAIVIIMSLYIALIFSAERTKGRMHLCASKIRKLLLGINQRTESIEDALRSISKFSNSRAAFFADTDGEVYKYVNPSYKGTLLNEKDKSYYISKLINYASKITEERGTTVSVINIVANARLQAEEPDFYNFMKKCEMQRVTFAGIVGEKKHISILGVNNPGKKNHAYRLLGDIAVCFSMAIYNKKYLDKTETVAATDSLTGLGNRMACNQEMKRLDGCFAENVSCIYIDVNELHIINNKYGHAAGDGMLLFIANSIKEVFANGSVFRIGGDEFLVFVENSDKEKTEKDVQKLLNKVEEMNYHISIGIDFAARNNDTEAMVSQAEKRMYEDKARFYQKKEKKVTETVGNETVERISTGIREFDALLSIMSQRYHGIYCVSLDSGKARRILVPAYLKHFSEEEDTFDEAFKFYVREMVKPEDQRALLSFLNYNAIKRELLADNIPAIEYNKLNGEKVILRVYALPGQDDNVTETLWVYESIEQ